MINSMFSLLPINGHDMNIRTALKKFIKYDVPGTCLVHPHYSTGPECEQGSHRLECKVSRGDLN
jgi:hypothetical protein